MIMNDSLTALKGCCDKNGGELSEVLVLVNGRHFVVGLDSFTDCMNETTYYVDSRYNIRMQDIEKWFLLRA
ncbi:hypothetical protein AB9_165 [Acinetobacter phage vB_AbaM_B9]|nr:hypothetical protein AB9_009 [Acinetobacter phage vB_AbaM_B9]AWD93321.1 hypothetical protein AB9_165 [Acinetobacter phage vB_AbaM_B9]